jgi:hypothetical protein
VKSVPDWIVVCASETSQLPGGEDRPHVEHLLACFDELLGEYVAHSSRFRALRAVQAPLRTYSVFVQQLLFDRLHLSVDTAARFGRAVVQLHHHRNAGRGLSRCVHARLDDGHDLVPLALEVGEHGVRLVRKAACAYDADCLGDQVADRLSGAYRGSLTAARPATRERGKFDSCVGAIATDGTVIIGATIVAVNLDMICGGLAGRTCPSRAGRGGLRCPNRLGFISPQLQGGGG